MKIGKFLMTAFIFLGVTSMLFYTHTGANEKYSVSNDRVDPVNDEYNDLQNTIQSNNKSDPGIKERLETLTGTDAGIFAQIGAGIYVVPEIIGLLFKPITLLDAVISSFIGNIPWIPQIVKTFVINGIRIVAIVGVLGALLRYRLS